MAYKQKGCTPITAKIQKGTKGGVTNPLLKAMGVPMKKDPSAAKQVEGAETPQQEYMRKLNEDRNKAYGKKSVELFGKRKELKLDPVLLKKQI